MSDAKAYGATSKTSPLEPMTIQRRPVGDHDVQLEILYCGICHSDIHTVRSEWGESKYPCVPGHEIVGKVTQVGAKVTKHKVGDIGAVGCLVESDMTCEQCVEKNHEQRCPSGVFTYNSPDRHTGGHTMGGYSDSIVVHEHFVLKVPAGLDLAKTAPLLCAGITTYAPLRRFKVGKGMKVGIVGLGGLGHMGLKFAAAFGAEVVLLTTSPNKEEDAKRFGASSVIITRDPQEVLKHRNTLDFILDTVSAEHDINLYMSLLKPEATLCLVGAPEKPLQVRAFTLIFGGRNLTGSDIGGIKETQEMLDFCAEHGITADIELIPAQKINEAYERVLKSDIKYRFVIDCKTLKD